MGHLLTADGFLALVTLTAMEIVLGIDNVVFIAILTGRLPAARQSRARRLGLLLALGMRIALLFSISWMMSLTSPLFSLLNIEFSGRSLILLFGGLFLIFKATREIYDKVEPDHEQGRPRGSTARSFGAVLVQIVLVDIVFSLDSVITAVGMADSIAIMVIAMVIAMLVMMVSMERVAGFIEDHPSVKMLALSFLLLIGVMLVAEGLGTHVSKGYIYFAMAFSLFVELLNLRYRGRMRIQPRRRPERAGAG